MEQFPEFWAECEDSKAKTIENFKEKEVLYKEMEVLLKELLEAKSDLLEKEKEENRLRSLF
jgi:cell shape-determining protein MreC